MGTFTNTILPIGMMAGGAALAYGSGGTLSPWAIPMMTTGAGMYSAGKQRESQEDAQYAQNMQRSSEQRYSPWLGRAQTQMGQAPTASGVSGAMQGGMAGLAMNQNINSMTAQQKLIDGQVKLLEAQAKKYGTESGINMDMGVSKYSAPQDMGMGSQQPRGFNPYSSMMKQYSIQ